MADSQRVKDGIRTRDPQNHNLVLYPAELLSPRKQGAPASPDAPCIVPPGRRLSMPCYLFLTAAWAAANRAIGTRNGEQET